MARPKEFDVDYALEKAVQLFWQHGFHKTSTRDLVAHLGIGRQSLYDTFGDKRSLYLQALDRYIETRLRSHLVRLEGLTASRKEILEYFAAMVELLDSKSRGRGCFLANSIVELSAWDKGVSEKTNLFQKRLEAGFLGAIDRSVKSQDAFECHDPGAVARSLSATVLGMSVLAKGSYSRDELVDIVSVAVRPLY